MVMLTTIAMMMWTVMAMTTTLQAPEWKVKIEADVHYFPPRASLIIIFLIIFLITYFSGNRASLILIILIITCIVKMTDVDNY